MTIIERWRAQPLPRCRLSTFRERVNRRPEDTDAVLAAPTIDRKKEYKPRPGTDNLTPTPVKACEMNAQARLFASLKC